MLLHACFTRVCAGTWNVGGKVPPDDLDLDGWLDIDVPADIYVLGYLPTFLSVFFFP